MGFSTVEVRNQHSSWRWQTTAHLYNGIVFQFFWVLWLICLYLPVQQSSDEEVLAEALSLYGLEALSEGQRFPNVMACSMLQIEQIHIFPHGLLITFIMLKHNIKFSCSIPSSPVIICSGKQVFCSLILLISHETNVTHYMSGHFLFCPR